MCREASFPQCVLAAQSGRRPGYAVRVLEAALEAQDPLIEFVAAFDRYDAIAESDPRAAFDCLRGGVVQRGRGLALRAPKTASSSGDVQVSRSDQPIIATAAAVPMANMQINCMENSVKRTLTTALVWRSTT